MTWLWLVGIVVVSIVAILIGECWIEWSLERDPDYRRCRDEAIRWSHENDRVTEMIHKGVTGLPEDEYAQVPVRTYLDYINKVAEKNRSALRRGGDATSSEHDRGT